MADTQILIVEDERITAEDIKRALESVGYKVPAVVFSGEEAVKKAREIRPDLILMDIHLDGEMDGIEAAELIRENYGIPVIYLTAYSDAFTVQRAKITEPSGYILKEPFGFIHKPFEESELHTAIEITLYRNKIEKRLRDHEQWFQAVLNSVDNAIIATDFKGKIKFMNPVAENLTGQLQEKIIGKNIGEVFEVLDNEIRQISKLNGFLPIYFDDKILKSTNKAKIHVKGTITPVGDGIDNFSGLIVVFKDFK